MAVGVPVPIVNGNIKFEVLDTERFHAPFGHSLPNLPILSSEDKSPLSTEEITPSAVIPGDKSTFCAYSSLGIDDKGIFNPAKFVRWAIPSTNDNDKPVLIVNIDDNSVSKLCEIRSRLLSTEYYTVKNGKTIRQTKKPILFQTRAVLSQEKQGRLKRDLRQYPVRRRSILEVKKEVALEDGTTAISCGRKIVSPNQGVGYSDCSKVLN